MLLLLQIRQNSRDIFVKVGKILAIFFSVNLYRSYYLNIVFSPFSGNCKLPYVPSGKTLVLAQQVQAFAAKHGVMNTIPYSTNFYQRWSEITESVLLVMAPSSLHSNMSSLSTGFRSISHLKPVKVRFSVKNSWGGIKSPEMLI